MHIFGLLSCFSFFFFFCKVLWVQLNSTSAENIAAQAFQCNLTLGSVSVNLRNFPKMKTASGVVLSWRFEQPSGASLPSLSSWAQHKATIVRLLFKPIPVAEKALHSAIPNKKITVPGPKITDWNLVWGPWIHRICLGGIHAVFCLSPCRAAETELTYFPNCTVTRRKI